MEGKPFKLRSGNKPAFKMMGAKSPANMGHKSPGKMKSPMELNKGFDSLPDGVQDKILKNDSPNKHIRRRKGHMDKYGQNHTNADHPNYWKKGEDGTTPKSKEVAADKADKKSKSTTTNTTTKSETKSETKPKKKKNFLQRTLQRVDDEIQSRMKKPRSDWDKEGYESERKQRYKDFDSRKAVPSSNKLKTSSPNKLKTDSPAKKGHEKKGGKGTPGDGGKKTYREGIKKSNPKYTDKVKELRNEMKEIERNIPDATVENNRRLRKLQNKVNKEMGSNVRHRKNIITKKYKKVVKK